MRLSEAPLPDIMNISYLFTQTAEPLQTKFILLIEQSRLFDVSLNFLWIIILTVLEQLLRHPLTVKKHLMEAMRLEPEGNLATTIEQLIQLNH